MVDNWKLCFNKYSNNCDVKFDFFKATVNGIVQFKVIKKKKYIFKTRLKINRVFKFKILYRKINIELEKKFPVNIINGEAYIDESQLNNFTKFYVELGPKYRRISKIKPIVRTVLPDFI